MGTPEEWASAFPSKRDLKERLEFIRLYVSCSSKTRTEFSENRLSLLTPSLKSSKSFPISREEYLRLKGELRAKKD